MRERDGLEPHEAAAEHDRNGELAGHAGGAGGGGRSGGSVESSTNSIWACVERVAQYRLVHTQPVAESVDDGRHRVDREAGRGEICRGRSSVDIGGSDHPEVHERQLPDAERVVRDHVFRRGRDEAGMHLTQGFDLFRGRFALTICVEDTASLRVFRGLVLA